MGDQLERVERSGSPRRLVPFLRSCPADRVDCHRWLWQLPCAAALADSYRPFRFVTASSSIDRFVGRNELLYGRSARRMQAKDDLSLSPIASGCSSHLGLREEFCTGEHVWLVSNRLSPAPEIGRASCRERGWM